MKLITPTITILVLMTSVSSALATTTLKCDFWTEEYDSITLGCISKKLIRKRGLVEGNDC